MALSKSLATRSSLPDLPLQPSHPSSKFVFPKREFGKKAGSEEVVPGVLFSTWPWLLYQTHNPDDVLLCHVCVSALKSKRMERSRGDLAFTSNGFKNWKDATIGFKNHEASASHKEALQVVMVIPATCSDVGEMFLGNMPKRKARMVNAYFGYCQTFAFYLDKALLYEVMVTKSILISCNY